MKINQFQNLLQSIRRIPADVLSFFAKYVEENPSTHHDLASVFKTFKEAPLACLCIAVELGVLLVLTAMLPGLPSSITYHFFPDNTRISGSVPDAIIRPASSGATASDAKDYIKWVDFDVTCEALSQALRYDVESYPADGQEKGPHLNWIELLAFLGARYGGDFSRFHSADLEALAEKLKTGEAMEALAADLRYYPYYLEAYSAVLGGMVGTYEIQIPDPVSGEPVWVSKYGLKAFSPIAKYFPYSDFDDFGVARSYGYRRQHLGHDMMGQVGTPVICVESGYVEAMGWNQYGGWRLGIRSFDGKRYYYYAHLRKNFPYHRSLQEGSVVQAGDVIGYMGRTGYSRTENTNNIDEPHLHFGLQLIFDESQREGNNEIWINGYELIRFLSVNRSETIRDADTKEYYRLYQIKDPAAGGRAPEQVIPASPY